MTSSPTWRLAPGQRLLHRCWDGECVLYNDLSGDTHLLGEFALALLQLLQAGPQPVSWLALEAGALPDGVLHTILTDLAALHLIDSTPC